MISAKIHRHQYSKLTSILAATAGAGYTFDHTDGADYYYQQFPTPTLTGRDGSTTPLGSMLTLTLQGSASAKIAARAVGAQRYEGRFYGFGFQVVTYNRVGGTPVGFETLTNAALMNNPGVTWRANAGNFAMNAGMLFASSNLNVFGVPRQNLNGFLSFRFPDSTAGNAFRYGWVHLTSNSHTSGSAPYQNFTVQAYAWGGVDEKLQTGQIPVPEPSSLVMAGLAAFVTGAAGLRRWRQLRQSGSDSRFERKSTTA